MSATSLIARRNSPDLLEILDRLQALEPLFDEYEPTRGQTRFHERLNRWVACVDGDDRELLLHTAEHLYFVGQREFDVLYRGAFDGPVMWWLSGDMGLDDSDLPRYLDEAIEATWFCPVTDSMEIARFHHLNGITGKDLRSDWRTLAKLGSSERIRRYMADQGLKRLVLLEDFIGSGNQASSAIEFALGLADDLEILVAPLLICPDGQRLLEDYAAHDSRLTVASSVVLPVDCVVSPSASPGEPEIFAALRELFRRLVPLVGAPGTDEEIRAFGFGKIGALCVMYTNCPNNVPPLLHLASDTWAPLFPRSSRK